MLTRLRVKNYALIEDLDVSFRSGLNVLTGITGAGKSILTDSMNLILGEKASLEMVRSGAKEAFVEATFELMPPVPEPIHRFLADDDILLLRREVITTGSRWKEGRSFAFINDRQVTLATLKEVGDVLADLLGQHHHQSLLNPNIHMAHLDRFCLEMSLVENYQQTFLLLLKTQEELKEALAQEQRGKERRELYRFQLDEIDRAGLKPGEETELREEKKVLQNIQTILSTAQRVSYGLSGDEESVLNRLKVLLKEVESLAVLDASLHDATIRWRDVVYSLEGLTFELDRYSDSLEADPTRLEIVEERLRLYVDFARKYGRDYESIMAYRKKIEQELHTIENRVERIHQLREEIDSRKRQVHEQGKKVSKERSAGAVILKEKIEKELQELGMKGTKFDIRFTPVSESGSAVNVSGNDSLILAGENGLEEVEFLISPNPGEPLKPLARIASGGEISRIMLALKTVLAKVDNIPLLIFDEIDAGIGGDIAGLVGKKLKKLSRDHQLICITHLHQIASYANAHFLVWKAEKGGRTVTEVKELSQEERVAEIARMIAGEEITELSLEHAREFLRGSAEA